MKKVIGLAVASVTLLAPVAARAQVVENMCGSSGTHLVCTRAKFQLSGGNLQVLLFNGVGTASTIMSSVQGVGVFNLDSYGGSWGLGGVSYVDGGVASDVSSDWSFVTGFPGLHVTFNAGADASGNGGLTTCAGPTGGSGTDYETCAGEASPSFSGTEDWVLFTFTHTGGTALNAAALTALQWGWKAQRVGTDSKSLECDSAPGNVDSCTADQGGGTLEDTPTPEPATMGLMAFGLAGMAAAARRRRKH
jgi:hypothetical protein